MKRGRVQLCRLCDEEITRYDVLVVPDLLLGGNNVLHGVCARQESRDKLQCLYEEGGYAPREARFLANRSRYTESVMEDEQDDAGHE